MRLSKRFTIVPAALAMAVTLLAASAADAKPKKPRLSNGCTMEQIQSPQASSCIDKLEQDVINGHYYVHNVFCGGEFGGMACCKTDGVRIFACKSLMIAQPPKTHGPLSGAVLDRGEKSTPPRATTTTGGGILEPSSGFGTQGPSATGTPLAPVAPATPASGRIN